MTHDSLVFLSRPILRLGHPKLQKPSLEAQGLLFTIRLVSSSEQHCTGPLRAICTLQMCRPGYTHLPPALLYLGPKAILLPLAKLFHQKQPLDTNPWSKGTKLILKKGKSGLAGVAQWIECSL